MCLQATSLLSLSLKQLAHLLKDVLKKKKKDFYNNQVSLSKLQNRRVSQVGC